LRRAVVAIHAPGLGGIPSRGAVLERRDECVLDRFLGQVEVAHCADQPGYDAPGLLAEDAVDRIECDRPVAPDA